MSMCGWSNERKNYNQYAFQGLLGNIEAIKYQSHFTSYLKSYSQCDFNLEALLVTLMLINA